MVAGKQPGLPRITFADETQVFAGGKEVVARHVGRGHTNGDAMIYFPSETGAAHGRPVHRRRAICRLRRRRQH